MNLSPTEQAILSVLTADPQHIDDIAAACKLKLSEALCGITLLELKGQARQHRGKRFTSTAMEVIAK